MIKKPASKQKIQTADETPFDNGSPDCTLVSETTQDAIIELCEDVAKSASPGFSYGRRGNISNNTWLLCEGVPSNRSGRWVYTNSTSVLRVFIGNENIDTFDIAIYYHDGDSINRTFVGRVTVAASRGGRFSVNFPIPTDKQLAVRLENGSGRHVVVGLELRGVHA